MWSVKSGECARNPPIDFVRKVRDLQLKIIPISDLLFTLYQGIRYAGMHEYEYVLAPYSIIRTPIAPAQIAG